MFPTSLVPAAAYQHPLLEGPHFYVSSKEPRASKGRLFRRNRFQHRVISDISLWLDRGLGASSMSAGAPSTRASVVNR